MRIGSVQMCREECRTSQPYRELLGGLMFQMLCVHPDLNYPVSQLGRFQQSPLESTALVSTETGCKVPQRDRYHGTTVQAKCRQQTTRRIRRRRLGIQQGRSQIGNGFLIRSLRFNSVPSKSETTYSLHVFKQRRISCSRCSRIRSHLVG